MKAISAFRMRVLLAAIMALLPVAPVYAGTCSSPTDNEGETLYNTDYHTFQFCNGTKWIGWGGASVSGGGGMTLISTQTASASASLDFTNLPTIYNTLFLNCSGLTQATNNANLQLQIGEGAAPTWMTASYRYAESWMVDNASGGNNVSTSASFYFVAGVSNGVGDVLSAKVWIDNVRSTSRYKTFDSSVPGRWNSQALRQLGSGVYTGDTNPITAIRLLLSSGNITSGTCSLYGISQ